MQLTEKQKSEGWRIVKFGDVAQEVKGSTKDPLSEGIERYVGLEHIDPESLRLARYGSIAEDNPTFTKKFSAGDILFGRRRAYLKKAAVADFDGICSGDITVIAPKGEDLLPDLLPFIVQSDPFFDWAVKHSAGGLSPRTKFKSLAEFEFPLPPRPHQVEVLSRANFMKKLDNQYSEALTSGFRLLKMLQEELIWGDKTEVKELSDFIDVKHGFAFKGKDIIDDKIGPIIVTPGNYHLYGGYNTDKDRYFRGEINNDYVLRAGDILNNMTDLSKQSDTLGLPVKIPETSETYLHNQRLGKVIKKSEELIDDYLFHYLCTQTYRSKIISTATGSTVKHTSPTKIQKSKIPVPNLETQKRISVSLNSLRLMIEKISNSKKSINYIFRKGEWLYGI